MIVNVFLVLYFVLMVPFMLLDRIRGKRHPAFLQRMGFRLPVPPDRPVIWIHAVSVGEIKAAGPLFKRLKSDGAYFLITTTTATGFAEAGRTLSGADAIAYLPIDFTWVVRRFVKAFRPAHFILVESDFWPNLLRELRKNGTKISLVSGKMSEKSARRFALFPRFSQRLFAYFDHVCVQNEEHYQRFSPFCDPARLTIAGNLKFDIQAQPITRTLKLTRPAITISCTHAPEEELILNALIGGPWTLLLAPRHPERFGEVAALLQRKGLAFVRWSESQTGRLYRNNLKSREFGKESPQNSFPERATIALGQGVSEEAHFEANSTMPKTDSSGCFGIILIDAMGQLPLCYTHSDLAILGGSFIEGIGGHNILEPCLYGTPVFFGPFMRTQKEFVKRVLESKAGRQLPIEHLRQAVDEWFLNEELAHSMRKGTIDAIEVGRGATARTLAALQQ